MTKKDPYSDPEEAARQLMASGYRHDEFVAYLRGCEEAGGQMSDFWRQVRERVEEVERERRSQDK